MIGNKLIINILRCTCPMFLSSFQFLLCSTTELQQYNEWYNYTEFTFLWLLNCSRSLMNTFDWLNLCVNWFKLQDHISNTNVCRAINFMCCCRFEWCWSLKLEQRIKLISAFALPHLFSVSNVSVTFVLIPIENEKNSSGWMTSTH